MQFQQLQMQAQAMQQQAPQAPHAGGADPASLGVPGGAMSSAAQGFSPVGPPNAPPVGAPGAPGPRNNIDQRLADIGLARE